MKKFLPWFFVLGMLILLAAGCVTASENNLGNTVSALATQVSNQEEWISYQATQIGRQQTMIEDLSTRVADMPNYAGRVTGSVLIHGGSCCIGGTAGETVSVDVAFEAQSSGGEVVDMRVMVASAKVTPEEFEKSVWEPFEAAREYAVQLPTNWSSFWVFAQYRDVNGYVSEIVADEIAVEGMPPMPTSTP